MGGEKLRIVDMKDNDVEYPSSAEAATHPRLHQCALYATTVGAWVNPWQLLIFVGLYEDVQPDWFSFLKQRN